MLSLPDEIIPRGSSDAVLTPEPLERMDEGNRVDAARDEGQVEGRAEGIYAVAGKLIGMNMPIDDIVGAIGLTREEVEGLRAQ